MKQFLHKTKIHIPFVKLFMKIAEPRVRRIFYFIAYIGLAVVTAATFFNPPVYMTRIPGGIFLVYMFGAFMVIGCIVCAFSVLPGIWMFERAGLYLLSGGIGMYTFVLVSLGASPMIVALPIVLIVLLAIRWLDIKEFLLAPREG